MIPASTFIDLTGQRYGRLLVIGRDPNRSGPAWFVCQCDCGSLKSISSNQLRRGKTRSCGCRLKEINSKGHTTHGLYNSQRRLYSIWNNMKGRCYRASAQGFRNYGGRGITVCDDWRNSFASFAEWSLANGYADELSLDRINPNGNYCAENCRWVTMECQKKNRRPFSEWSKSKTQSQIG